MSAAEHNCSNGHPMRVESRFEFDHEPGDIPRDTESLRMFEAAGIELGADVTLWLCPKCDEAIAIFDYPDGKPEVVK